MGADGYVSDPTKPVEFEVRCYECSQPYTAETIEQHRGCVRDGRLRVSVDGTNYEPR